MRLAEIVTLCIGKKPETRYQDGDQFAADLRAVVTALAAGPVVAADVSPRCQAPRLQTQQGALVFPTVGQPLFEKTIVTQPPTESQP